MPIFEYRPVEPNGCPRCHNGFERLHKSGEAELKECPDCGKPVRRVVSTASLAKPSPSLDEKNIEKHGFTQYRKSGTGQYEKTAGKGPKTITRD